jgi:formylglycine-generating enzyme required for sulfatase activity
MIFAASWIIRVSLIAAVLGAAAPSVAEEVTNSIGMKLRLLDAGRYERGERDTSPNFNKDHSEFNTAGDESPPHPVVLTRPFYLGTTEVTVAQFRQFVEGAGYRTSAETNPRGAVGWDPRPPENRPRYAATFRDGDEFDWKRPGFEQGDDHPVVGVSWADAMAFCAWLSKKEDVTYRLPTEAEWEYAARAGKQTHFWFGDKYRGVIQLHANIGNVELEKAFPDRVRRQWLVDVERDPPDQHIFTAPVGSYEASPWGLFDLYGNVWEWCADRYLDTAYTEFDRDGYQQIRRRAIDPLNDKRWGDAGDWRVIRGGSWFNSPVQCRAGVRGYFEASEAACYIGFRVARDTETERIAAPREQFAASEAARATLMRLADRMLERRDGRLTIEHRSQPSAEFLAALQTLDEPFDLQLDGRGELTAAQLSAILAAPQLRGLLLSNIGPGVGDADLALLTQHSHLELLQLTGAPKLTDAVLAHCANLSQLELLQLDSAAISDEGLKLLPELTTLKTLRLAGTASRGQVLSRLRGSPLDSFACEHVDDDGALLLAGFSTLREASLAGSSLTGRGLAKLARLPRLQSLDLASCASLRDEDFAVLGGAYELRYLHMEQTAAGDRAAAAIVALNNLDDLVMGSSELTDAGLQKLCGIVSLRSLRLTPEAIRISDAGLVDLWRLVNLHSFAIASPQVTGSGLATLHELPALEWLHVEGAKLGDVACEHIAKSRSLQQLTIGGWRGGGPPLLSDAGLQHLAQAQGLNRLELFRQGTQVTDGGWQALRRDRPQLQAHARN